MFMSNRFPSYDDLLGFAIRGLNIPDDVYLRAVARYRDVARFVASYLASYTGEIYTQGSVRLGTMVAPVDPTREYDIDLVCQLGVLRDLLTKRELKALVGRALKVLYRHQSRWQPRARRGQALLDSDLPG